MFLFQIGAIKTFELSDAVESGLRVSIPDWCD